MVARGWQGQIGRVMCVVLGKHTEMGTWWIDEPRLMGSSNPSVAALEQLRSDGFDVLVSFLKEDEQPPRYDVEQVKVLGFERQNIPARDFHPPAVEQLEQFVTLIAQIPATAKAVVHCEGGIGRTGTFAAAYWVAKGQSVSDAIARVRQTRPGAVEPPTGGRSPSFRGPPDEPAVVGLTRLSQRTPWQDHRFALDRTASRLLTTVH